jgi:uncharacterized repeat protein (TIGR01451 family)
MTRRIYCGLFFFTLFHSFACYAQLGQQIEITENTPKPYDVKSADMDGDGDLDIVFWGQSKLGWFENEENGDWPQHVLGFDLSTYPITTREILIRDFDQDGDTDIVVFTFNPNQIILFSSSGDGDFSQQFLPTHENSIRDLKPHDVDQDGDLDLVTLLPVQRRIEWHENLGQNEFAPPQTLHSFPEELTYFENIMWLRFGDLDNDGLDDMVISLIDLRIVWMRNLGNGLFEEATQIENESFIDDIRDFQLADLNGDGNLDIVIGSQDETPFNENLHVNLSWFENLGNGEYNLFNSISNEILLIQDIEILDLNNDNHQDVVALADPNDDGLSKILYFFNDGSGVFIENTFDPFPEAVSSINAIHLGDLDGDGELDLLTSSHSLSAINLFSNFLSAEGVERQLLSKQLNSPTPETGITIIDIDQDGLEDILCNDNPIPYQPVNSVVYLFKQLENGEFTSGELIADSMNARYYFPSDIDGDGDIDFVTKPSVIGTPVYWQENLGNGTWDSLPQILCNEYSSEEFGYIAQLADFNGDGLDDLFYFFLWGQEPNNIWKENLGSAEFGPSQSITDATVFPTYLIFSDLNNDGNDDLLYFNEVSGEIKCIHLSADGTSYIEQVISILDSSLQDLLSHDVNNDGLMDVVIRAADGSLYVFYSLENMLFSEPELVLSIANNNNSLVHPQFVDFNGDNITDITYEVPSIRGLVVCYASEDGIYSIGDTILQRNNFPEITKIYIGDLDQDGDAEVVYSDGTNKAKGLYYHKNLFGEGCTDPTACNYDANSFIDDGSCCYECGCPIPGSVNFNELSCETVDICEFIVQGKVFFDENENGILDEFEQGLALQEVSVMPPEVQVYTDDQGIFSTSVSGSNEYEITISESDPFPIFTTPSTLVFDPNDANWNQNIVFGISDELPFYDMEGYLYSNTGTYLCDFVSTHHLCFRNEGNMPLNIVLQLEYDELFQGLVEYSEIDSITNNSVFFSDDLVAPGELACFDIGLHTPTVEFIGEFLESSLSVSAYYEEDLIGFVSDSISIELTCAYDPNDKQVFPIGYSEEHYVHPDTTLEYLIRFQNTGNAPATDVIIRDTIDANLDLSSFQLLTNSHPVYTTVKPADREVEFYFQDIMLPDSVNNEPESHGFVSFSIDINEGAPLLNEINNRVYIFFDNNPPIVTNTTWTTLYDCSLFEVSLTENGMLLTASEGDNYQWFLDGEPIEDANSQTYLATSNGNYAVQVSIDFPCSSTSNSVFVTVTSVEDLSNETLSLFPNPLTSSAVLRVGNLRGAATLNIYNRDGKRVRSQGTHLDSGIIEIERGNLNPGFYTLEILTDIERLTLNFVVI